MNTCDASLLRPADQKEQTDGTNIEVILYNRLFIWQKNVMLDSVTNLLIPT